MIIYQVYPRSFKDTNADGIGDLAGITEKLPYISKLGVDAVWISPFVQSPQKDFGYDVSDYRAIDSRFGTMADFKKLIKRAHGLGLKVLMDQVWCHCSDRHPWFLESRQSRDNARADWFVWAEPKRDGTPPNNWLAYFGGPAWDWEAARGQYYFHQFLPSQPTFNLRNPAVRKALLDIGRYWLKLGVDGFRLDAVHTGFADPKLRNNPARPADMPVAPDVPKNIPQARQIRSRSEGHADTVPFLEEARKLSDKFDAILLGEVAGENPYQRVALYTKGKRLHMAYNFGLLAAPPDAKSFKESVVEGEKGSHGEQGGHFAYALSNHDVRRVATRWSKGLKPERVAKMALLFGLSMPGTYCMYQGEELGLPESDVPFAQMQDPFGIAFYPRFKGRDGCRTPFPWSRSAPQAGFSKGKNLWLPLNEAHRALAVDVQERDHNSTLAFARRLVKWRKENSALAKGKFKAVNTKGDVIAFERVAEDQRVLAVFNFGKRAATFALPKGAWSRMHSVGANLRGHTLVIQPMGGAVLTPKT
jgi:alpha-glucosidase